MKNYIVGDVRKRTKKTERELLDDLLEKKHYPDLKKAAVVKVTWRSLSLLKEHTRETAVTNKQMANASKYHRFSSNHSLTKLTQAALDTLQH